MIAVVVGDKRSKDAVAVVGLEPVLDFGVAEHLEDVRSCDAEQDVYGSAPFLTCVGSRGRRCEGAEKESEWDGFVLSPPPNRLCF